jgi:hypothetical protein
MRTRLVVSDAIGMRGSNVSASGSAPPSMRLYPGIAAAEIEARMIEADGRRSLQVRWQRRRAIA